MAGFDLVSMAPAVKTRYTPDFVKSMVYPRKPLFAALKKMTDMGGTPWRQPVVYEDPQATSPVFATAQAQASAANTQVVAFDVTRVRKYQVAQVDGESILATKGDKNAFFELLTNAMDRSLAALGRKAAYELYRSGFGDLGQVQNSSFATAAMQLGNSTDGVRPDQVVMFAKGQKVQFAGTINAASYRAGGPLTVTNVDRNTGIVTLSANLNSITGIAQNDFIFLDGERTSANMSSLAGLEAWVPAVAPTSTLFFNVDRTQDSRLGGLRFPGAGNPIDEVITDAAALAGREGAQLDFGVINPVQFGNLVKALGTKVQYVDMKAGTANVGFRGISLHTPAGTIELYPDQDCPSNRIFLLQLNTWMLGSLGELPRILDWDDKEILRVSNADAVEARFGYYGNLICKAPGWNVNVQI